MLNINEQVVQLYRDGVLLEDIHKSLKLPIKSIVSIIYNNIEKDTSNAVKNKKSYWYIYFCEFMFENKSLKDIVLGRSISIDECIDMIGNVIRQQTVPNALRQETIERIAKEIGETPSDVAKGLEIPYSKTFATTIKRIWR